MTREERYDAVVTASGLLRAVFNELVAENDPATIETRRRLYVAATTTGDLAQRLQPPIEKP